MLGKTVWVNSASSKDKPVRGAAFAQGPGCSCRVVPEDGEAIPASGARFWGALPVPLCLYRCLRVVLCTVRVARVRL